MAWSKKIRKWAEGERIELPSDLFQALETDTYVFWRRKLLHVAVVQNWSYRNLSDGVRASLYHYAVINPEWQKKSERTRDEQDDG